MTSFQPEEDLTFETVVQVRSEFLTLLLEDKSGTISLDLSKVRQCDSAGLAFMIEVKKLCKKHKKMLEIREMPAKTEALAAFCGVQSMLYE